MELTTTFSITCPCGCGSVVEASSKGFSATSCEVVACESLRKDGIVSTTIRKTEAYSLFVSDEAILRHKDGLVSFGGGR